MITQIHPKLPMRNSEATKEYYINGLGFTLKADYGYYLIIEKDAAELHFFHFAELQPADNYGQVYIRVNNIEGEYQTLLNNNIAIHPNAPLTTKPWGQKEFALLDPDNNLLTFGEASS